MKSSISHNLQFLQHPTSYQAPSQKSSGSSTQDTIEPVIHLSKEHITGM